MAILPKTMYGFKAIPIKTPIQLVIDLESFIWKTKQIPEPSIGKTILNNERTSKSFTTPAFKLYYRAVIKQTNLSTPTWY